MTALPPLSKDRAERIVSDDIASHFPGMADLEWRVEVEANGGWTIYVVFEVANSGKKARMYEVAADGRITAQAPMPVPE